MGVYDCNATQSTGSNQNTSVGSGTPAVLMFTRYDYTGGNDPVVHVHRSHVVDECCVGLVCTLLAHWYAQWHTGMHPVGTLVCTVHSYFGQHVVLMQSRYIRWESVLNHYCDKEMFLDL